MLRFALLVLLAFLSCSKDPAPVSPAAKANCALCEFLGDETYRAPSGQGGHSTPEADSSTTASSGGEANQPFEDFIAGDRAALVAFYNATDGPNWRYSFNWLSNKPLSQWWKIKTERGRVASIRLFKNKLKGAIPPEIGNLTNLVELDLNYNPLLGGPIPPEIGRLTRLSELRVRDGQLSGSIPPEIGQLTELWIIDLENNQLTGSIPSEIGNLTKLGALYLDGNQLSGRLPPEIGQLTELASLRLGDGNQFSGPIPQEWSQLKNLQSL